jgi:UDP-4-amino-4,6-dideoxy-N-acetyl-beta-L-altrosamine transaminase
LTNFPGKFLPYGRQIVEEDDIEAVSAVLRSDWLTTGPGVEKFEADLAEHLDVPHVVSCSSGTAALHLAAIAAGLGPGDVVVVPSVTFLATASMARHTGAEILFADVDPDSGLMTAETLKVALSSNMGTKARAVFPVHLAGQCVDPIGIAEIARDHDLIVVEDAAHAIGTTYTDQGRTRQVGDCRLSDMAVFSFHPVKTIAMGEGGAITTRNPEMAERLGRFRNHGMTRNPEDFVHSDMAFDQDGQVNPWYYEMHEPGFNYRASDIHCALATSQLGKLVRFKDRRKSLVAQYDDYFRRTSNRAAPLKRVANCSAAWHLYPVLIDFEAIGKTRSAVMTELRELGVGTQVHYQPVHMQPYFRQRYGEINLPGAEAYYRRTLSLPLFGAMENEDVDRVCAALNDVLTTHKRSTP